MTDSTLEFGGKIAAPTKNVKIFRQSPVLLQKNSTRCQSRLEMRIEKFDSMMEKRQFENMHAVIALLAVRQIRETNIGFGKSTGAGRFPLFKNAQRFEAQSLIETRSFRITKKTEMRYSVNTTILNSRLNQLCANSLLAKFWLNTKVVNVGSREAGRGSALVCRLTCNPA